MSESQRAVFDGRSFVAHETLRFEVKASIAQLQAPLEALAQEIGVSAFEKPLFDFIAGARDHRELPGQIADRTK